MTDDQTETALIVAGGLCVTAAVAWALWPKPAQAATVPSPGRPALPSHAPASHAPASHAPASHSTATHAPATHAPTSTHAPATHAPASTHAPVTTTAPPVSSYMAAPQASSTAGYPVLNGGAALQGAAREAYFERNVVMPEWSILMPSPRLKLFVASDYLKLSDGARVPLWPSTAERIAGRFSAILPTRRIVDLIYSGADVKVPAHPMTPGPGQGVDSWPLIPQHVAIVDGQIAGRRGLIAGHQKDILVGNVMRRNPGKVIIYGWNHADGSVIQPVSAVHSLQYGPDYSHGVRLINRTVHLDGMPTPIEFIFADPTLAPLLSSEGVLPETSLHYPT